MKIRLQVKTSSNRIFPWESAGTRVVVGRDPDCELSFPDDETSQVVSWRHAQIELSPRGALLRDLGSTNGTFLDGARIMQPVRLFAGSEVRLGQEGPCLQVAAIEVAPQASTASRPDQRGDAGGPAPVRPPGSSADSDQRPTGTRAMLVQLQQQHRNSLWLFGGLGAVALVVIAAMILVLGRNPQHVATNPPVPGPSPIEPSSPTPEPSPPAPDPPRPAPEPSPNGNDEPERTTASPPDWKQVVAPYEESLVWLGAKNETGLHLPLTGGFVVGPNQVATSALAVIMLRKSQEQGKQAFVYCPRQADPYVLIKEFIPHPDFDIENPGSPNFADYNVGVVVLDTSLPVTPCIVAGSRDIGHRLKSGAPVIAVGYDVTAEQLGNKFDPLNPPTLARATGTVGRASLAGNTSSVSQRTLLLDAPDGLSGCPVFDQEAKVVGVLWVNHGSFGIVASNLEKVMK